MLLTAHAGSNILCLEVMKMKKIAPVIMALLLMMCSAYADEPAAYFEEHGAEIIYANEPGSVILDDGIVVYTDTEVHAYPCRIEYEVTRDDTFMGKRYVSVRLTVGFSELPEFAPGSKATIFYSAFDYYTGAAYDIGSELYDRATDMYDFTIEHGEKVWNVKAGMLINIYYPDTGLEFVLNYQFIMDEDYNGAVMCIDPVFEFADRAEFEEIMDHMRGGHPAHADTGNTGDGESSADVGKTDFRGICIMVK